MRPRARVTAMSTSSHGLVHRRVDGGHKRRVVRLALAHITRSVGSEAAIDSEAAMWEDVGGADAARFSAGQGDCGAR